MKNTKIEWCDHTINLWWGCTKVHTGCKNCYAEKTSTRFGNDIWGNDKSRKRVKSAFSELKKLQNSAKKNKRTDTVFIGSMMDIFEGNFPLQNPTPQYECTRDLRQELLRRIENKEYENLVFLFLTKRPFNIVDMIPNNWLLNNPPKNLWLGCSISDQETADIYINELSRYPNFKLFLSIEPQVGEITELNLEHISWVIQGGESGANNRPFKTEWANIIREKCKEQNTPYFFKQIDKKTAIPTKLLVREFPVF